MPGNEIRQSRPRAHPPKLTAPCRLYFLPVINRKKKVKDQSLLLLIFELRRRREEEGRRQIYKKADMYEDISFSPFRSSLLPFLSTSLHHEPPTLSSIRSSPTTLRTHTLTFCIPYLRSDHLPICLQPLLSAS